MTDNIRPFKSKPPEPPPPEEREPGECPVTCLGTATGVYYFLSPSGEIRVLRAQDFRKQILISLFDGDVGWCWQIAPAVRGSWNAEAVIEHLVRGCVAAGTFDPGRAVHGLGVWQDKEAGEPQAIVHCGDAVWFRDEWVAPGFEHGKALYARQIPIAKAALGTRATKGWGEELERCLRLWAFRDPAEGLVVLGYIGSAMLGAAAPWRAHLHVRAHRGAGKSWLAELVLAALGGQAVNANNFTEASLRQSLTDGARAIVLDEAEGGASGAPGRVEAVIELLRQMSGGKGAEVMRGGADGTARRYAVTGAAYLSAIIGVALKPQDRSRIAEIRLVGPSAESTADRARQAIEWAAKASPALRARVVQMYPLYLKAIGCYRRAILADGGDARQADQWAAILAGRCILVADEIDDEAARQDLEPVRQLIEDARAVDEDDSEAASALNHLYSAGADSWSGGDKKTIGQIVMDVREHPETNGPRLGAYGLRMDWEDPDQPGLLVANKHQALERIFQGTDWTQGRWKIALAELDGVTTFKSQSFGGAKSRSLRIPVKYLPRPGDRLPSPRPQRKTERVPSDDEDGGNAG